MMPGRRSLAEVALARAAVARRLLMLAAPAAAQGSARRT